MPDIGQTIRTLLLENSTITATVDQRIYSDVLPQRATIPAIIYWVVTTTPNECLGEIVDATQCRMQIDTYSDSREGANSLADTVRLQLQMYRGSVDGQQILGITMPTGESYLTDNVDAGTQQWRYINTQEFYVWYRTTTSFPVT